MTTIIEWMIENKIAENGFAAAHISVVLHLPDYDRDEQKALCKLYGKWRPKTDRKNEVTAAEAYDLTLAGVDPDDVPARQIEMFVEAG